MSSIENLSHWKINIDDEDILWLAFDRTDSTVNTLNASALAELDKALDTIQATSHIRGIVILSGKAKGFIAGADAEEFKTFKNIDQTLMLLNEGQRVFKRLADLSLPTVALIKGFCLGGGLELALACKYRIAESSSATQLGLPEVQLGIQPGWGGTVRLLRLCGPLQGLPMLLQGRSISAKRAYQLNIIDEAVPARQLLHAARAYILQARKRRATNTKLFVIKQRFFNSTVMRTIISKIIHHRLSKRANPEHYPAPYAILDNWQTYGIFDERAFAGEVTSVAKLFFNYTTKNLVGLFSLKNALKEMGKQSSFNVSHVHVIGAGVMGADIAAWCATKGFTVSLQDQSEKQLASAMARIHKNLTRACKDRYLFQQAFDRLIPDIQGHGIKHADVIIEAIVENLAVKQQLFNDLEDQAKPSAILSTNTSSILLDQINQLMRQPERLVGIHFFNPVAKMTLVEVVFSQQTTQSVLANALNFVRKIKKLPLPVKSSPGFLINRILSPYLMESVYLLDEGVPAELIDKAACDFGMPIGPIELADRIGLDICLKVGENLTASFGGEVPRRLTAMVNKNHLGRKTQQGFYYYSHGKAIKHNLSPQQQKAHSINKITERLILLMLNEVVACLREGVVASPQLLDAGMIFGTGFAPFRGGPIQYAKSRNIDQIVAELNRLQESHGPRFTPDSYWSVLKNEHEQS